MHENSLKRQKHPEGWLKKASCQNKKKKGKTKYEKQNKGFQHISLTDDKNKISKESRSFKPNILRKQPGAVPDKEDSEERRPSREGKESHERERSRRRRHTEERLEARESSTEKKQVVMLVPRVRRRCLLPKPKKKP